jgi:hypothetical protein
MVDEFSKVITRLIYPELEPQGFRLIRTNIVRIEDGIVQRLYFQLSAYGSRRFCVTACANLIAGNEGVTLQPGFRLTRDADRVDLVWFPSRTAEEAERSAHAILRLIRKQALPFFENIRTLAGFSALLASERWASMHHLCFQRGVTAALRGDTAVALRHLSAAIQLYERDGREWCLGYIERSRALDAALRAGDSADLLAAWCEANSKAHGIH